MDRARVKRRSDISVFRRDSQVAFSRQLTLTEPIAIVRIGSFSSVVACLFTSGTRSNPGHLSSPLVMHIASTVSTFALALKAFYFGG